MNLVKWYGDAVDPHGRVTIAYLGRLRLGPFTLGYRGRIDNDGRNRSQWLRAAPALPAADANGSLLMRFGAEEDEALIWSGAQSRSQTLWAHASQRLTCDPQVLNAKTPSGSRGYAERLEINVAPWHLGLRELHWGRFCGERHSVAWIRWEGEHPLEFVMVDGVRHGGRVNAAAGARTRRVARAAQRTRAPR